MNSAGFSPQSGMVNATTIPGELDLACLESLSDQQAELVSGGGALYSFSLNSTFGCILSKIQCFFGKRKPV